MILDEFKRTVQTFFGFIVFLDGAFWLLVDGFLLFDGAFLLFAGVFLLFLTETLLVADLVLFVDIVAEVVWNYINMRFSNNMKCTTLEMEPDLVESLFEAAVALFGAPTLNLPLAPLPEVWMRAPEVTPFLRAAEIWVRDNLASKL